KIAVILRWAEIAVAQVSGEVKMSKGVPCGKRKRPFPGSKPSQSFRPFAFGAVAVRVMSESEAPGQGEISGGVVNAAMPSFREKIELRGIERGIDRHPRESSGDQQRFRRIQIDIAGINQSARAFRKANSACAYPEADRSRHFQSRLFQPGEHGVRGYACFPQGCLFDAETRGDILSKL